MWTFLPAPHSPLTYLLYVVHTQQNLCSVSPSWCFHIMCNGRDILLMYLKITNHLPDHHPSCVPICLATCLQHCLFVCPVFTHSIAHSNGAIPVAALGRAYSIQAKWVLQEEGFLAETQRESLPTWEMDCGR